MIGVGHPGRVWWEEEEDSGRSCVLAQPLLQLLATVYYPVFSICMHTAASPSFCIETPEPKGLISV